MTIRRTARAALGCAAVTVALVASCTGDGCACSWTSGAVARGTVLAADGASVAGAVVRFTVFDGGSAAGMCSGGRYERRAEGEAITDADGRYRHALRISNATPRAACVIATATPPGDAPALRAASAAAAPLRFRVCGDGGCEADSVAIALRLPLASSVAVRAR